MYAVGLTRIMYELSVATNLPVLFIFMSPPKAPWCSLWGRGGFTCPPLNGHSPSGGVYMPRSRGVTLLVFGSPDRIHVRGGASPLRSQAGLFSASNGLENLPV
jgi:hypothetical protein